MADDLPRVTVRLYADLTFFAPEAADGLTVPLGRPRSVKDLLESVGVPHPEVAVVVVDGKVVGWDHRVAGGARVAAYPPFTRMDVDAPTRPPRPDPRFVLDVHLGALARRLRVLGLDVAYSRDVDDAELAAVTARTGRVLLTRDRGLLMRREVVHGYCPRSDQPDEQVIEVARRFLSPGDLAPFTRCPACGAALRDADPAEVADEVGAHTRATRADFARCTGCAKVYWEGSHVTALLGLVDRVRDALAGEVT